MESDLDKNFVRSF